ncbi:hypothetical protein [Streptomyces longispororuber]|uniref:hypothetical protein n=1 Tax=Streptomyces longispororuber TaxID=68230 RepID=UPI002108A492|nr:hypothetical protein [Streptomyces longispororuber]MCQ4208931.1 hypothetical protein [Streptomyces longispororuber]
MLVILEGPARVVWHETATGHGQKNWTPTGLWPDEAQRTQVREHLDGERPLLVLLDDARSHVPMLREEWQAAPCRVVHDLVGADCADLADDGDEIVDVRLPFLDWLPQAHRERAARFLAESDAELSRTPMALLPPLLAEEPRPGLPRSPRFARRLLPNALTADRLAAAVEHLFTGAQRPHAATAGCEATR